MKWIHLLSAVVLVIASARPVTAQESMLEAGLFSEYTAFRQHTGCACYFPKNGYGAGARTSMHLGGRVHLEVEGFHMRSDLIVSRNNTSYSRVSARANLNVPFTRGGFGLYLGGGPTFGYYEGESIRSGMTGVAGLRLPIGPMVLRAGTTADYYSADEIVNVGMRVGLGYRMRR